MAGFDALSSSKMKVQLGRKYKVISSGVVSNNMP
jgi:hypothetical protein